jgi:NAD(P)-dependent dehydrogenase (short-subunit alcohol dehydrogenase family)
MRVLIVGASGVIGRAVVAELGGRHEILTAGRTTGELRVDLTSLDSVRALFEQAGRLDAVVASASKVKFAPFAAMTAADFEFGFREKFMGQVNLVLVGRDHVVDGGSFTLTSGLLDREPVRQGAAVSTACGAVNAFVRAAAIEMPRGLRINAVSPGMIQEAMEGYAPYFRGFEPVPAARAALAYARSVEGAQTGQVYQVR